MDDQVLASCFEEMYKLQDSNILDRHFEILENHINHTYKFGPYAKTIRIYLQTLKNILIKQQKRIDELEHTINIMKLN